MKTNISEDAPKVQPEPDYFFKCPNCETEDDLYEYQDCIVRWGVNIIDGKIQYDPQPELVNSEINEYHCGSCGYELPVSSQYGLLEWLKESPEQQKAESLE